MFIPFANVTNYYNLSGLQQHIYYFTVLEVRSLAALLRQALGKNRFLVFSTFWMLYTFLGSHGLTSLPPLLPLPHLLLTLTYLLPFYKDPCNNGGLTQIIKDFSPSQDP